MLTRRMMLGALAGSLSPLLPTNSAAQDQSPLILRPIIEGVSPRYARYALPGPYVSPSAPTIIRGSRGQVAVFAPAQGINPRIIVFSHGELSDPSTYRSLLRHWVSHGFVVLAPLHSDAVIEQGPTLRQNKPGDLSRWNVSDILEDPEAWRDRAAACSACLDDLVLFESAVGLSFNIERPVICGHGYGAYVASLLLGATAEDREGQEFAFRDPRFFSGIVMSPQGPGVMGLTDTSWRSLAAPLLHLLAEFDQDFTGQPLEQKARSYELSAPGYKHLGILHKGTANTFSGQMAGSNQREAHLFEVLKAITTAFLLAYANYEQEAFEDMSSNFFSRMSLGAITERIR